MGLVYLKSLSYIGPMNQRVNQNMTMFTPLIELGHADRKFLIDRATKWCEANLPIHHSGFPPDVKWKNMGVEIRGKYDSHLNIMTLSTTEITDVRHLLKIFLHEWCHSVQDFEGFDEERANRSDWYYLTNKWELEANRYKVVWYLLWIDIKKELGSSPTLTEQVVLSWNKFYREILGF